MTVAIRVENLGKSYRVGRDRRGSYRTLRESLADLATAPFRRLRDKGEGPSETFWALKDVSFEVQPGEVVGVIGRNGAGKSTLLKVLSRITRPSRGRVELHGRVGSLLEVGTGFHPELTGRENVYLNGSILGMSRKEIDRRFDEIVAFAEVEKFLDTPVKRYSSGMYVRLAFAVAAHLEPEILIVDEVLAVGDDAFQKKCLGRIREISGSGRTVLLVSHNMFTVESLCTRCIFLAQGAVEADDEPRRVTPRYLDAARRSADGQIDLRNHPNRGGRWRGGMERLEIRDGKGKPTSLVRMGGALTVGVTFDRQAAPIKPVLGVVVKDNRGQPIFGVNNRFVPGYRFEESVGVGRVDCRIDNLPLMPGTYLLDLYLGDHREDVDVLQDAASFEVVPDDVFGSGKLPPAAAGPVCWPATWSLGDVRTV